MGFRTNDTNVGDILRDITNGIVQLPDFQRGWVWNDNKIKALIASITNSYPVGALMFMDYGSENIRFKYRAFEGAPETKTKPRTLVLDGQQRLTSIFCAMYSPHAVHTENDRQQEIECFYYIDIAKSLQTSTDRADSILSFPKDKIVRKNFGREIDFDLSERAKEFAAHMFPLNIAFDLRACSDWRNEYQRFHNQDNTILDRFVEFDTVILRNIQSYKIPVITLGGDTPKEAVCQVFENVNTGGVSLTVFELVTATFAADNFELRVDWEKRTEKLIDQSALSMEGRKEAILSDVSPTDFLTAITLLSRFYKNKEGGPAVSCKRKDVLDLSLSDYNSYADKLSDGFVKAASFLKEQRVFTSRDLPYSTQLIPLSVLFTILGHKGNESTTKEKIEKWYWCGVFGEMYGGSNETRYVLDVVGVMTWIENGASIPDTVTRASFDPSRLLSLQTRNSAAYKGVMALILKKGAVDFISGRNMDFTVFLDEGTDIHHVFPYAYCKRMNLPKQKWNSVVNKTPLFSQTNKILGGIAPSEYLSRIEKGKNVSTESLNMRIESHCLSVSTMRQNNFDAFFIDRAAKLLDMIGEAMGKTIQNRDSEEIVRLFGGKLDGSQ